MIRPIVSGTLPNVMASERGRLPNSWPKPSPFPARARGRDGACYIAGGGDRGPRIRKWWTAGRRGVGTVPKWAGATDRLVFIEYPFHETVMLGFFRQETC